MDDGFDQISAYRRHRISWKTHLTCSLTSLVSPASSCHFPRYSSPRNGLNGFFSVPYLSLRLAYCCFKVVRNHLSTSNERLAGSGSEAGATKIEGCSVQYAENSVRDVVPRMKGGAVMDERSPLKEAIDYLGISVLEAVIGQVSSRP